MFALSLAAVALGLSNFAGAISIGLTGVDQKLRFRVILVFGFFEAAMPLAGLLIGHHLAKSLGSDAPYLGGGLLILTGVWTFVQSSQSRRKDAPRKDGFWRLVVTGAALSVDNLVVGFGLGTYKVSPLVGAIVIASVSVLMAMMGLEIGNRLGGLVEKRAGEFGAVLLILLGVSIATRLF